MSDSPQWSGIKKIDVYYGCGFIPPGVRKSHPFWPIPFHQLEGKDYGFVFSTLEIGRAGKYQCHNCPAGPEAK